MTNMAITSNYPNHNINMSFRSICILSALALATMPVSGSEGSDGTGYEFQSSRAFSLEASPAPFDERTSANGKHPTSPMLRKASPMVGVAKKESYRDESIPLVRKVKFNILSV